MSKEVLAEVGELTCVRRRHAFDKELVNGVKLAIAQFPVYPWLPQEVTLGQQALAFLHDISEKSANGVICEELLDIVVDM